MLELQRITTADVDLYNFMEGLMKQAFPSAEYRDLNELRLYTDTKPHFYNNIIMEENRPIGFFTYWDFDTFYYAEHFAVDPSLRNGGYGKQVLALLRDTLSRPIVLEVEMPEAKEPDIIPEDISLDIVYEDDDVLVINKPAGMVVHPAAGNYTGTLVNAIMHHCGDRLSSINGVIRPGIVHRIDKDTSGLLMVAKNDAAHNSLAQQLAEHSITRKYVAIVWDNLKENDGIVDAPIGRHPKDRKKQSVMYDDTGKRAVTHWKVLERFGSFTLVECQLETGRTHQIRVHMAYIKHPLLGDSVYGPAKSAAGAKRQMLHAKTLGFVHPSTGKYIEFDSQLPEDFSEVLNKLRKQNEQN